MRPRPEVASVELIEASGDRIRGILPVRATPEAAGADVFAVQQVAIPKKGRAKVPLGFKLHPPSGTYARLAPRSSLASKYSLDVGRVS